MLKYFLNERWPFLLGQCSNAVLRGWRGGAMVGRRTYDQEVASSIRAGAPLRNGDFGQVVHTHLAPLVPHSTLRTRTDRTRPNQRSDRFIVGAAFLQNSSTTCIRLRHFPLIKIIGDNRSRFSPGHVFFLSRDRGPSNIVQEQPVFEKTCATTQKNP